MAKHLMFSREYWDALVSGAKRATIRVGDTGLKAGDEVFVHCGGYLLGKVRIVGVSRKRVKDLTEEDARKDGFASLEELLGALKRHYPRMGKRTVVSVVEFEWIERRTPVSSERFAWCYELSPAEVARLALERCGDLSEDEKRVLRLVAELGSIRKAAIRLGGLSARPVVRGILREIARRLEEKGLIERVPVHAGFDRPT